VFACERAVVQHSFDADGSRPCAQNNSTEDVLDALELRGMLAVGSMATVYNATLHGQRIVCKVRVTVMPVPAPCS
jgi:hypothetical protein